MPRKRRNPLLTLVGWTAILGSVGILSSMAWTAFANSGGEEPDKAEVAIPTLPVTRGDIERSVIANGVIQPSHFVDVGAQISGQLKSLTVRLGDQVKRGELLAEIDSVVNTAKVTEAEAILENLKAQRSARHEQLGLASQQLKRSEILIAKDALARSEAEIMASNYRVALTGVQSLDAQIKQAAASLDTAKANLGYTRILAPIDGEVLTITARAGQTLNANNQAPVILRLADLETMTVWAQVAEGDVTRVALGTPVHFTILGEPDKRHVGRVKQILPAPEIVNGVVFYNALFDVKNKARELKVQMTAQVTFTLESAADAVLVPLAALRPDKSGAPNRYRVDVMRSDRTIETRAVSTGVRNSSHAQVLDGLAEGDEVVVRSAGSGKERAKRPGAPAPKPPKVKAS